MAGEIIVLTSIYMVMPVGRPSWRHALLGGVTAALLWEITRHTLVWYFSTMSQVKIVYGSLTTAIVVLLSLEIAAMVLLLGAQVIAEFERARGARSRRAAADADGLGGVERGHTHRARTRRCVGVSAGRAPDAKTPPLRRGRCAGCCAAQ